MRHFIFLALLFFSSVVFAKGGMFDRGGFDLDYYYETVLEEGILPKEEIYYFLDCLEVQDLCEELSESDWEKIHYVKLRIPGMFVQHAFIDNRFVERLHEALPDGDFSIADLRRNKDSEIADREDFLERMENTMEMIEWMEEYRFLPKRKLPPQLEKDIRDLLDPEVEDIDP